MILGQTNRKRPYMNLPLKGNTNDKSLNKQNPVNTSVTTTTGIFGESNGAYEWNAASDRLSWASSIGNEVVGLLNNTITIIYDFYGNAISVSDYYITLNQISGNTGNRSFYLLHSNYPGLTNLFDFETITSANSFSGLLSNNNEYVANVWANFAVTTKDNTTNLDTKMYKNGVNIKSGTINKTDVTASTLEFRIGAQNTSNNKGAFGKMSNFRIYDITLTDGQIKILNKQKGRIKA